MDELWKKTMDELWIVMDPAFGWLWHTFFEWGLLPASYATPIPKLGPQVSWDNPSIVVI